MKKEIKIISILLILVLIGGTLAIFANLTNNFKNNDKASIEKNWQELIKDNQNKNDKDNKNNKDINNKKDKETKKVNKNELKIDKKSYETLKTFLNQNIEDDLNKILNSEKVYFKKAGVKSFNKRLEGVYSFLSLEDIDFDNQKFDFKLYHTSALPEINGDLYILVNKNNNNKYLCLFFDFNHDQAKTKNNIILIKINGEINESIYYSSEYKLETKCFKKLILPVPAENKYEFWNYETIRYSKDMKF